MANGIVARVGRRIRALREKGGYSQEEFAVIAELNRAHYGRIERGRQNLTLTKLASIAAALGVEPAELLGSDGDETSGDRG